MKCFHKCHARPAFLWLLPREEFSQFLGLQLPTGQQVWISCGAGSVTDRGKVCDVILLFKESPPQGWIPSGNTWNQYRSVRPSTIPPTDRDTQPPAPGSTVRGPCGLGAFFRNFKFPLWGLRPSAGNASWAEWLRVRIRTCMDPHFSWTSMGCPQGAPGPLPVGPVAQVWFQEAVFTSRTVSSCCLVQYFFHWIVWEGAARMVLTRWCGVTLTSLEWGWIPSSGLLVVHCWPWTLAVCVGSNCSVLPLAYGTWRQQGWLAAFTLPDPHCWHPGWLPQALCLMSGNPHGPEFISKGFWDYCFLIPVGPSHWCCLLPPMDAAMPCSP